MEGTSALHTPYALRQLRQNPPAVSPSEICPDPPRPQKESRSFGSSADRVNDDLHSGSPAESQPQFRASPLPSPLPSPRRPTALNLRLESSLGKLVSKSEDSVRTELNVWGFHVVPKCGGASASPKERQCNGRRHWLILSTPTLWIESGVCRSHSNHDHDLQRRLSSP